MYPPGNWSHIYIKLVCVKKRVCAQSIFCDWGTSSLCSRCVCVQVFVCIYVGWCILPAVCICRVWCARHTGFIAPLDLGVCISVCVLMCMNILCAVHLSLASSYPFLSVCFAPVNQSSPFTFQLSWSLYYVCIFKEVTSVRDTPMISNLLWSWITGGINMEPGGLCTHHWYTQTWSV